MKKKVLFLCTGNSCRSQMAEGLLRHLAGEAYDVASAGTAPAGLHPTAVEIMREVGVDIAAQRSKSVGDLPEGSYDWVITVCDNARDSCPVFPGNAKRLHWSFADPALASGTREERLKMFRRVRDEIAAAIGSFLSNRPGPYSP